MKLSPSYIDWAQVPSPCFVLDERKLIANLELMQRVQRESGAQIICALKGYSVYQTFPLLRKYLAGATASSLHEARLVFEEMGEPAHTYCPAYLEREFDEILGYSSHLTFNSLSQWEQYKERALAADKSCGIRLNPQYSEVETDLYNPAIPGSRLGVTAAAIGDTLPEGIEGIHFHSLCENDSFVLERTLKVIEEKAGHLLHQAKWFNMGGGHLMTREGYDHEHLIALLKRIRETYNVDIILEPGSAVGWQTGYLKSEVVDLIDSQGVHVALLDVSVSNHMPDCLEMPYKPHILDGHFEPVADKPMYKMGGLTCLAGDYLGDYSFDAPLKVGDRIVFDDMIHYTMVKTTTFNGVNLPSIGCWTKDDKFVLYRSFGYESYKDRLG